MSFNAQDGHPQQRITLQMLTEPVVRTPVVEYDPISSVQINRLSPEILRTKTDRNQDIHHLITFDLLP